MKKSQLLFSLFRTVILWGLMGAILGAAFTLLDSWSSGFWQLKSFSWQKFSESWSRYFHDIYSKYFINFNPYFGAKGFAILLNAIAGFIVFSVSGLMWSSLKALKRARESSPSSPSAQA